MTLNDELVRIRDMPDSKKKYKMLAAVVITRLQKSYRAYEGLRRAVKRYHLEDALCYGLRIYLCGHEPDMQLAIRWTDHHFPNRLEFLQRFSGEFREPELTGLLGAAGILAACSPECYERLAYDEPNYLLLLNIDRLWQEGLPSAELVHRLIEEGDDLQANIGLYHATLGKRLQEFRMADYACTEERRVSLLFNAVLCLPDCPGEFAEELLRVERQALFVREIRSSGKLRDLRQLHRIARLIHGHPVVRRDGGRGRKDPLYAALVYVLKSFITERRGIFRWDERTAGYFRELIGILPKRYRLSIVRCLSDEKEKLMVSELDRLVRYRIYWKDIEQQSLISAMETEMIMN